MKRAEKNILLAMIITACSCSGTRHLPEGEKLYTGAEVRIESTEKVDKRKIKSIAESSIQLQPNKSFLGMRPKLWMYQKAGENTKGWLAKKLRKKGEAPVLISDVKPGLTAEIIDAALFNNGFFRSYTETEIKEKKHTAEVLYTSHVQRPYVIDSITFKIPDKKIQDLVVNRKGKSLVNEGDDYLLENLVNERTAIDEILKDNGYFYFNPDYLIFRADTSAAKHTISLELTLKDSIPPEALNIYKINRVIIDEDYVLQKDEHENRDTIIFRDNLFIRKDSLLNIKPGVILRSVFLRKNEVYSRENHNITLNRLMSMGNFRFVQLKLSESDSLPGYLDALIYMTPMSKRTVRAELDLVSKSNNFTGPRANFSLQNRNTFRGAELLNFNLAASFESQIGGRSNAFSYTFNPQMELTIPRFLLPFELNIKNSRYIPKTRISLSFNYSRRVNYFDMRTLQFIYGFNWKENIRKEHEFNPLNISYTSIGNKSAAFSELLNRNSFLKKSYEEMFIAGTYYSYTYNQQLGQPKKVQYFFNGTAETAGNLISLGKNIGGSKPDSDRPLEFLGTIYSQFARFSTDGRLYYNFRNKDKIAIRLFGGIAKPYGNSAVLPYTKQFFSGGPNSIRAFQINSVGPGNFEQETGSRGFLQLGGEVKLEMNAEYRFTIWRMVKGALFTDAGNVWLLRSSPSEAGSPFTFSGFMNEIAVGSGIGVRIDVSFFILRFDLATPLRKPWQTDGEWTVDEINFRSSSWRKDNLKLNIAIGYPF